MTINVNRDIIVHHSYREALYDCNGNLRLYHTRLYTRALSPGRRAEEKHNGKFGVMYRNGKFKIDNKEYAFDENGVLLK